RERVKAFSFTRSCCRAASHSCSDTIGVVFIAICPFGCSVSLSLLVAILFLLCFLKQSTRSEKLLGTLLLLSTDVTKHIRMNVQTDIGHVVKMFAGNKPDDLADLAFGIITSHTSKGVRVNLFIFCQLRHIIKRCALCIGEEGARAVLLQRIEFPSFIVVLIA